MGGVVQPKSLRMLLTEDQSQHNGGGEETGGQQCLVVSQTIAVIDLITSGLACQQPIFAGVSSELISSFCCAWLVSSSLGCASAPAVPGSSGIWPLLNI